MQRISRAALVAAIVGVSLGACGGSSATTTEPQAPTPTPAATTPPGVSTPPAVAAQPAAEAPTVTEATPAATATAAPASSTVAPPAEIVVPAILQLKAPLIGGGEFDFAAYAGKPLAVWFWAPG